MTTKIFLPAVLLFGTLSGFLLCIPASAQTTAVDVVAAMKKESGGAAWDQVATLYTVSAIKSGGLTGTQDEWDDALTGRYSVSSALGPAPQRDGYDGTQVWSQDENGRSRYVAATDDVQAARSMAYRVSFGYWFPARSPGSVSYLRRASENGRGFDVLQVTPTGGRPFQLWVDGATHLAARTVEAGATETDTTSFSDYRPVGGLLLPFGIRTSTGDPKYDTIILTRSITVNAAPPRGTFALPPPPPPDFAIAGHAGAVTVPFRYAGRHILVDIRINGRGPFPAVLDTGGRYVLTPALARHVGLEARGALAATENGADTISTGLVRAETIGIGRLVLRRPIIYVLNLPALRDRPIVGFELFSRFTIRMRPPQAPPGLAAGLPRLWELKTHATSRPTGTHGPRRPCRTARLPQQVLVDPFDLADGVRDREPLPDALAARRPHRRGAGGVGQEGGHGFGHGRRVAHGDQEAGFARQYDLAW